ncbi:MAG: hypothetical protein RSB74_01620 [Kiritimatiellia bacterium]
MKTLFLAICFFAAVGSAGIQRAVWGTLPPAPVYVGQAYDLTLTIETEAAEEVSGIQLEQGLSRQPDEWFSAKNEKGQRVSTFVWHRCESAAQRISFPATTLIANLTTASQTFGFMQTLSTVQREQKMDAFSYEVQALPAEAKGLPVGDFVMTLGTERTTVAPGEVIVITAIVEARGGNVPKALPFVMDSEGKGRTYPFVEHSRSARSLMAHAYYVVPEERGTVTLTLNAMNVFDVTSRTVLSVMSAPLTLNVQERVETVTEQPQAVTVGAGQGLPVRFAPSDQAPLLGVLGEGWKALESLGDWTRVMIGTQSGWIRTLKLGETHAVR